MKELVISGEFYMALCTELMNAAPLYPSPNEAFECGMMRLHDKV
jgi:hypothetical protein